MTPHDVRRRFNGHKVSCVQTLNAELIRCADEVLKERPVNQGEYGPCVLDSYSPSSRLVVHTSK